ncbi:MAG: hypothetical protein WD066_05205 [Planctomycetaceae bacterium]
MPFDRARQHPHSTDWLFEGVRSGFDFEPDAQQFDLAAGRLFLGRLVEGRLQVSQVDAKWSDGADVETATDEIREHPDVRNFLAQRDADEAASNRPASVDES